jgi:hypothetical protein
MSPTEALNYLDQVSRLAPIVYEAQLQRCQAVDAIRAAISQIPHVTLTPEEPEPDVGPVAE